MEKLQWIQRKIYDQKALALACNGWRLGGKKIVFTNGCFDILHHGHLHLLAQAAGYGNILIAGLNTDRSVKVLKGQERPITNEADRMFQVASLLCVDVVVLFDEQTPEQLIHLIKPNVLVKGGDYTIDKIVGASYVQSYGGSVKIIPFVEGYSTSSIISRIRGL